MPLTKPCSQPGNCRGDHTRTSWATSSETIPRPYRTRQALAPDFTLRYDLVAARRRVSAVARRVVGVLTVMPAVGLEPEWPLLGLFLGEVVTSRPSVA